MTRVHAAGPLTVLNMGGNGVYLHLVTGAMELLGLQRVFCWSLLEQRGNETFLTHNGLARASSRKLCSH